MRRRLLLCTICFALVTSATPSYGGFVDSLVHRLIPRHKHTVARHASSHPGEIVWSGLVMADNAEKPPPIATELTSLEPTLKELFGYNQFEVIGQSRTSLKNGQENWNAASKHFALHVDAKGPSEGGYIVDLKLVQKDDTQPPSEQTVLETSTKLSKRSPLVIKGPQIGNGQLLLVLVVQ